MIKYLLYIFCFLPFIFPNHLLGTDIQFYAFIMSLVYLATVPSLRFSWEIKVFLAYSVLATVFGACLAISTMVLLKCVFQYLSLFVISLAVFNMLLRDDGINENVCKIIFLLWFAVGFMQEFINPDFCKSIVANSRTTTDRGVSSLASEPSFYGLQCFYFLFIASQFKKHSLLFSLLIIVMALFFAQSFVGVLFVAVSVLLLLTNENVKKDLSLKWVVVCLAACAGIAYVSGSYFEESRLGHLVSMAFAGEDLFKEDASSAVRMNAIYDALETSYDSSLIPSGYQARIGSMFGGILVELGIFGIGLMTLISYLFVSFSNNKFVVWIAFFVFFALLFTNMQLANPSLAFVLALSIFMKQKQKTKTPVFHRFCPL